MKLNYYRNGLIVGISFVLMLIAFFYKNIQLSSQMEQLSVIKQEVRDIKEIIGHKSVWSNKNLSKKVEKLKTMVPVSKVRWNKEGKKVTASYKELTSKELNRIITRLMSLAVQIVKLDIVKSGENYHVECICKW